MIGLTNISIIIASFVILTWTDWADAARRGGGGGGRPAARPAAQQRIQHRPAQQQIHHRPAQQQQRLQQVPGAAKFQNAPAITPAQRQQIRQQGQQIRQERREEFHERYEDNYVYPALPYYPFPASPYYEDPTVGYSSYNYQEAPAAPQAYPPTQTAAPTPTTSANVITPPHGNWLWSRDGNIPPNATIYGYQTGTNIPVYYCQVQINGVSNVGTLIQNDACYIDYYGTQSRYTIYRVLVPY